nr:hypothetical protein [Tanacetum cinerariifolium]
MFLSPTFVVIRRLFTILGGVRGDICVTTFRNALRAQYLPHSSMYIPSPSITIVRPWFTTIRYKGEIGAKGTLKKSCLPSRWRLLTAQIMQCLGGKTGSQDQMSNKDATILYCLANGVKVDYAKIIWEDLIHKLNKNTREKIVPYPSVYNLTLKPNQPKEPPYTDHMKAICNLDVTVDSKALKPCLQTEEETKSSSAKDKSPSHHLPPTPVVGEMHKEAQQAVGGPTSLGATSVEGAHPQLSSGISTTEADPRISAPKDSIQVFLIYILKDTRFTFFTPDSPPDELIIVSDESEEEEEVARDKDTEATFHDVPKGTSVLPPPSLKSAQIQELMAQLTELLVTYLKPELSKLLASYDFASCLPTKLEELLLKITGLFGEIKELKKHVRDMEIEPHGDLKEIPTKLETFTSTISSFSSQLKILDSLPSLLHKITDTLNRFATMVENASGAASMNFPSAGKATASLAEGKRTPKMLTQT